MNRSRLAILLAQRELMVYIVSAVVTAVTTALALEIWRADWTVPFYYQVDAVLGSAGFKTVVETGWYENQPLLGAPYGQVFHDWKIADNLGYVFVKLAALFTSDPNLILNVYYVLGFILAALTAVWFLRLVGVSRVLSVTLSVLYAVAPYHFLRAEYHLFLAAYYPVPLAMGVVYLAMRGRPLWGRKPGVSGWLAWARGPWLFTTVVLTLVASANSYYGFFTILLIALSGLFSLLRTRDWRRFLGAFAAGLLTVLVMLVNMLPDMIYSWEHGTNTAAVVRAPFGIEVFSLKLAQLVLPVPGHRVSFLDQVREFYIVNFPPQGENPSLGLIGAFGFLALLGLGLYFAVESRHRRPAFGIERRSSLGALSALTIFSFLIATTGGFSSLIGYFTSDLRGWNRMSIVIALFSLAAVGLIIDPALRRVAKYFSMRSIARRALVGGVAVLMLAGGYLDQVTPMSAPDYEGTSAAYKGDGRMVVAIERAVGAHASIVQLPYRDFPESAAVNGVPDTDQLKPYLHSSTLRWTGGGIKGRPEAEWVKELQKLPVDLLTQSAAAAGFDGILVDLQSYGDQASDIVAKLRSQLGAPAVRSDDQRYEFYSLTSALLTAQKHFTDKELRLIGSSIVSPVLARLEPDVQQGFNGIDLLKPYVPRLLIENPRKTSVNIDVEFSLVNQYAPGVLRFTTPDGGHVDAYIGTEGGTVTIPLVASPGRSFIGISVLTGHPFPPRIQAAIQSRGLSTQDVELHETLGTD